MIIFFRLMFLRSKFFPMNTLFQRCLFSVFIISSLVLPASAFEVVNWNIQKGNNPKWQNYINNNLQVSFWGIQEATSDSEVLDLYNSNYYYFYNPAWLNHQRSTGTLSAWQDPSGFAEGYITKVLEPITLTPKSFIISTHDFGCNNQLKIVNVHMINFLLGSGYKNQLDQIYNQIKNWDGPLIVLGDFNNWNPLRTNNLRKWARVLKLSYTKNDTDKLIGIDHVFFKNLKLKSFRLGPKKLSDHRPMHAEFSCAELE